MRIALALAFTALALLAAGCGGSGSKQGSAAPPAAPSPAPATTGPSASSACRAVPASLVARIRAKVVLAGARLETPKAVATAALPGLYFVSLHVLGGGADPHSVATFATADLAGKGPIFAIDSNAALISEFGAGISKDPDLTVRAPGVLRSRECVGGPNVSPGITAPPSGGHGAPGTG